MLPELTLMAEVKGVLVPLPGSVPEVSMYSTAGPAGSPGPPGFASGHQQYDRGQGCSETQGATSGRRLPLHAESSQACSSGFWAIAYPNAGWSRRPRVQRLPEQFRPHGHRLVRDADDVYMTVADHVEDDMASLWKTAVARVYVVPFASRQGIPGQPLEPSVHGTQIVLQLTLAPGCDRVIRDCIEVGYRSWSEPETGAHP